MAEHKKTLLVELYYVVSAPKNHVTGRRRRWTLEGGPHDLRCAQLAYEERCRRLHNDGLDIELVRAEFPMERLG